MLSVISRSYWPLERSLKPLSPKDGSEERCLSFSLHTASSSEMYKRSIPGQRRRPGKPSSYRGRPASNPVHSSTTSPPYSLLQAPSRVAKRVVAERRLASWTLLKKDSIIEADQCFIRSFRNTARQTCKISYTQALTSIFCRARQARELAVSTRMTQREPTGPSA